MSEKTPLIGEEAFDTETGRAVWWDGLGWSYTNPEERENSTKRSADPLSADYLPLIAGQRPERLPLSYSQQRLWFINQLQKSTPEYNMPSAFRLRGELMVSALENAITHIVERHEILRTRFDEIDGEPVQIIASESPISLRVDDLSLLDDNGRKAHVNAALRREREQAFDLALGPLLRLRLLKLAQDDHVLLWTVHHIVSDAWSQGVFLRELMALYEAFSAGRESPLPALPVQYADFALWQRSWLNEEAMASELDYWRTQLAGAPGELDLPRDRVRPPQRTFLANVCSVFLPAQQLANLEHLIVTTRSTLYMTLLAAFAVFLERYSRQNDIVVGSPIANRRETKLEQLIGFFANTLVFRLQVNPEETFRRLLVRVRATALEAFQHQDLPFERLVQEVSPQRSLNTTPIFQVVFALQNAPAKLKPLQDMEVEPLVSDELRIRFDLEVHAFEQPGGIALDWLYDRALFDRWRVEQMARHYGWLLQALLIDPDLPLCRVQMMNAEERQMLLEESNATSRALPEVSIPALFEAQCAQSPEAAAAICGERSLTYAELNRRADRLAKELIGFGVGLETLVGVALDRSIEMIIALLAILKSGGAYVPIAHDLPSARRNSLIAGTGLRHLVTTSNQKALYEGYVKHCICVQNETESQNEEVAAARQFPNVPPTAASYVNFTSGSTGEPKAILISHASVVRLIWNPNYVKLGPSSRLLQFAPLSFDAATFEIWGALLNGGVLVVMPPGPASVEEIAGTIARYEIDTVWLTAGLFQAAVDSSFALAALAKVKYLIAGGDVLSPNHVRRMLLAHPYCHLINGYGPTENTTFSCCWSVRPEELHQTVPIGYPISSTRAYVLDERLEPVPQGVTGELYVAGLGLARGYLNRTAFTAERFVPDPYGRPGTRMYCTGDLVRRNAQGALEFQGRTDQQVKIRGFRVEPGEVEAVLHRMPGVSHCAVLAQEERGDKHLVAYVVPENGTALNPAALQDFARQRLPAYMTPADFVVLEVLPLTVNGKLDRAALPGRSRPEHTADYRPPRTPMEELLCEVFAHVLTLDHVGIDDNFFARGGHSLAATRLVSRIRSAAGVETPLRTLFEHPTVAALAPHLEKAQKILHPLAPQLRPDDLPLSFAQQRLWFIDQLEKTSTEYNLPVALRLRGSLHRSALERAINAIVERHEALRTRFSKKDGSPVQVILPHVQIVLQFEDLRGLSDDAKRQRVAAALRAELERPFDLAAGPLLRTSLFQGGEDDHVLLYTFHHIVFDGWSEGVFNHELMTLYEAFREGREDPLPPLTVQYADFALWQRDWLNEEAIQLELGYWKTQLADIALLQLPLDHPRSQRQTFAAEMFTFTLGTPEVGALKGLGWANHATLYMTLLAAFAALLERHSGQQDIVVGSPIANRQEAQLEQLIGFFVNTLVMRLRVDPQSSFAELLVMARTVALEAYQHQNLPFERLVEELSLPRSLNTTPAYQVVFALQNAPSAIPKFDGLKVEPISGGEIRVRFDLEVHAWEHQGEIAFYWIYNRDLFDRWRIEQMAAQYARLLTQAAANSAVPIWQLDLLSEQERGQLLHTWNQTSHEYPHHKCVHELFEEQAERTPNAVAVVFGEKSLTYAELNARANQLAHHLIKSHIRPEALVGIAFKRSLELPIVLLGVLKAGGCYLPLDPEYPETRLSQILTDAAPALVIVNEALALRLPCDANILAYDAFDMQSSLKHEPAWNPTDADRAAVLFPSNAAYVIYTSGSTGTPKGVSICHSSVSGLLSWAASALGGQRLSRVLATTSLNFDVSVFELFAPLVTGGATEIVRDLLALMEPPRRVWKNSLLSTVPSVFSTLLDRGLTAADVNTIVFAGEALPAKLVQQTRIALPHCRIADFYGPTETTIYVTAWHSDSEAEGSPCIGRPIWNTRVYVLDSRLQPVPAGVAGELYVTGTGLARGYLKRPGLTAERFVADPYATGPGGRMYRTGDLARWRTTGDLEYLGRSDQQVKVRGYRIELGEIESALSRLDGVKHCGAVVRDDGERGRQIVAYVAPVAGTALDPVVLRGQLQQSLPEHMLPSRFVILDTLPLTASGKLDRHALPQPEAQGESPRLPQTTQEKILCELFGEVLELEHVGVDDNFFLLGGHSLVAMLLISRIQTRMEVEIPVAVIFEHPTVASLAQFVSQNRGVNARPSLGRQPRTGHLPLSYAQRRMWFIHQLQEATAEYNLTEALRLRGELHLQALQQAIQAIVARHEVLRTHFVEVEGEPWQVIVPDVHIELPCEDLSALPEDGQWEQVVSQLRKETAASFDLARGPLLRLKLLKLAEHDHILVRTMHHIVSDAWSQNVFKQEFMVLYDAFREGRNNPLQPLEVQYADFALWQRAWLDDRTVEQELGYWRKQLAGIPEQLELPRDRPRPAFQTFAGDVYSFIVPSETMKSLKSASESNDATLYMTLLAAFALLLQRHSRESDIVIGSPIANRSGPRLEQMMGFLVNTLVMRVKVNPLQGFQELLRAVRDTALEAFQHQDLPFERLVEDLGAQRSLSTTPIFQVLFGLHHAPVRAQRLKAIDVEPVAIRDHWVRFDLELYAFESEQQTELYWMYNRDLFDRPRIERMADQYGRLLDQVVKAPDQAVGSLDLLDPLERQEVLVEWNERQSFAGDNLLHRLFERQAELTPRAPAATYEQQSWTYAELNRRSNQLAHYLLRQQVGPELRVGICLERSLETVLAILGVLKAGGVYLPLDPQSPAERLSYIIKDAQAAVVLTSSDVAGRLLADGANLVFLDRDWRLIATEDETNPVSTAIPANAAYVIYTSGSTGKPKGVVVTHQNVVRLFSSTRHWFDFSSSDVWTLFHSYAFDFSVWEIWGALFCGGRLVIVPYWVTRSPESFYDLLKTERVTVLNQTPSAFRQLNDLEQSASLSGEDLNLRLVIFGGEALEMSSLHSWFARHGDARPQLVNMYGITETTVHVTHKPLKAQTAHESASIVGERIPDLQTYILDEFLQPAGVGVPGELYVGGAGLARGYLNQPGLSASRFVPHPFSKLPGDRLYRSGDLARYRKDGEIEYLGRIDQQVKIRGHRIELGEVEAVLGGKAGVKQCVVVVRDDAGRGKQLVAYIEPLPAATVNLEVVRKELGQVLPDYMVPSAFVLLEKIPITVNGKLDRRALPAPDHQSESYRPPVTAQERQLCQIFEEVLGVTRVGLDDNFFDLGGHSLLAPRLVGRIRDTLDVSLNLRALFESPTVAELSLRLHSGISPRSAVEPVLILRSRGSLPPLFCLHGGSGLSWGYAGLVRELGPERPVYGLQFNGIESPTRLPASVEEMAETYLRIIRKVQPHGLYHLVGMSLGGYVGHSIACRLQEQGEDVGCLALLDSYPVTENEIAGEPDIHELFELVQFDPEYLKGRRADVPTVIEVARQMGHVLGWLEIEQVERMLMFVRHAGVLRRAFRPDLFRGNMLFVAAVEGRADFFSPAQWQPYVNGEIQIYEIHCRHPRMMDPGNLAAIGRVLREYLPKWDPNQISTSMGFL
jgi:amino acid adenylation domain-containing protein